MQNTHNDNNSDDYSAITLGGTIRGETTTVPQSLSVINEQVDSGGLSEAVMNNANFIFFYEG